MPTYIYETTDATKPRRELQFKQSVHDDPLVIDPATGESIRRIMSAGYTSYRWDQKTALAARSSSAL